VNKHEKMGLNEWACSDSNENQGIYLAGGTRNPFAILLPYTWPRDVVAGRSEFRRFRRPDNSLVLGSIRAGPLNLVHLLSLSRTSRIQLPR